MTDPNYLKHLKILGKIVRMYDVGGFSLPTTQTLLARLMDQAATGESDTLSAVLLLSNQAGAINQALSVSQALRAKIKEVAEIYFLDAFFRNDVVTAISNPASLSVVLQAWQADFTANSKTLTTEAATGFVNFFKNVLSSGGSWPQSGSPSYPDATYVVDAVV